MLLYRPVGIEELKLMFDAGMKAFPPRLPEQPIFYPVLNLEYAVRIAKDWNTKSPSFAGYATRFSVDDAYAAKFPVQTVGSRDHVELWVPAEELSEFNAHLEGPIAVAHAFFGEHFRGYVPTEGSLHGKDAIAQLVAFEGFLNPGFLDFSGEVTENREAVFLHYLFWGSRSFTAEGVSDASKAAVLRAVRNVWSEAFPERPLPG